MRRWNGWGDDTVTYAVPPLALALLAQEIGAGVPPSDVELNAIVSRQVPPTRLPHSPILEFDPTDRVRHARGQSLPDLIALRSGSQLVFPDAVAHPTTAADIQHLIRYAAEIGAAVIPYGGGTSVVGHINISPGLPPALTVDLNRMNSLLALDATSALATFGAGVTGADLEAKLRAQGYTLGHFPQSFEYSTLGGWIATRSKGQQSVYYGGIERLFAGGQVETPLGSIRLSPLIASATGPDLREIVLGSEGRIGIITEATMRISRLPESEEFHAAFFPGFEAGLAAVREIAQARIPFSMLRLLDEAETELTLSLGGRRNARTLLEWLLKRRRIGVQKSMLLFAATGTRRTVHATVSQIFGIIGKHGGVHFMGRTVGNQWQKMRFRTPYLRNTLWEYGYAVDTIETAVDWARVPVALQAIRSALQHGLETLNERVHVLAHLSHVYPSGSSIYITYIFRIAPDAEATLQRWRLLKDAASLALLDHGGTISHQHGIGLDHLPYMVREKGELGLALLRDAYKHFDPNGILNPGKLFS
jgi:alkyldihydroxyacetonephosphate synthase